MNIYVGNLNFQLTEDDIRPLFEDHGKVNSVKLITDRETGRPKGFGFVEMPNDDEAQKAINALNGADISGRAAVVNEARPRPQGGPGGNQGGFRGNQGGYGNRGGSGNRRDSGPRQRINY